MAAVQKAKPKREFPRAPCGKTPLEYLGGFEAYQEKMYKAFAEGISKLTKEAREYLDDYYKEINGLENGLLHYVKNPCYATIRLSEALNCSLDLNGTSFFNIPVELSEQDKEFWEQEMIKTGARSISGPPLDLGLFFYLYALEESDQTAEEKNAQGIKPNYDLEHLTI